MPTDPATRSPELKLEVLKQDAGTIVRVQGRITSTSNARLENAVRDRITEGKPLVLDLAEVDYIDSAGLGTLVSIYTHARRADCRLKIANPKERIRDLFNRSKLASVFEGDSFDVLWEAWSRTGQK